MILASRGSRLGAVRVRVPGEQPVTGRPEAGEARAVGEASPIYLECPQAPARIRALLRRQDLARGAGSAALPESRKVDLLTRIFANRLLDAMREYCEFRNLIPRGVKLAPEDIWNNCCYVLSFKLADPQFSGQTKERLTSREAAAFVSGIAKDAFALWLNQHTEDGDKLAEFCISNAQKRVRASKKIERKRVTQGPALPGKLADCSSGDPARSVSECLLLQLPSIDCPQSRAQAQRTFDIGAATTDILVMSDHGEDFGEHSAGEAIAAMAATTSGEYERAAWLLGASAAIREAPRCVVGNGRAYDRIRTSE